MRRIDAPTIRHVNFLSETILSAVAFGGGRSLLAELDLFNSSPASEIEQNDIA
jgi:hypothetical protein